MVRKIIQKIKDFDKRLDMPNWLIYLLGAIFVLRIPSFFEPFNYGDQMIYLTLGNAIRHGLTLYKDIYDNKPPLLYILAAIAGNVFWFKVILAIFAIVSIVLFWKLASKIFENKRKTLIATVSFSILTTIPLLEGNIFNAENFMILFTIGALLLLFTQKHNVKNLILAGAIFSLAALFKIPAAFEVPVIVIYWFVESGVKGIPQILKKTLFIAIGFLIPILLTIVWFYFKGALSDYIKEAFLQNIGYLSSFRPTDIQKPFLVRNAPLLIRGLIIFIGAVVLWLKRKKLSSEFIFATLWLLFALFGVTLSERPYPHYLLQVVAPASILIAILVRGETVDQVLTVIPLALLTFVPIYYKFYYYPTFPYYERFIKFATGQITKEAYLNSFDKNTTNNYKISDFIVTSTAPDEKIFVWGDSSATIYALTRRLPATKFVQKKHIFDLSSKKETLQALSKVKPSIIVILSDSPPFSELMPFLNRNYMLISSTDGSQIWHKLTLPQQK